MKTCSACQTQFEIREIDRAFYDKVSPVIGKQKYAVPEPTRCPACRMQRRLSWRNERSLYWRDCDGTGKRILSVFSAESPYKVFENDYWYSDSWNALDYGRDFDFNRPFFEQFSDLLKMVPQLARSTMNNQNCDFVNQCGWSKNCYLIFEADENENCFYCGYIYNSRTCIDDLMCYKSELCYDCINVQNCYDLKASQNCDTCTSSSFLKNCIGCKDCFACINLTNKQYCFFNEQLSKEDYEARMKEADLSNYTIYQLMKKKFEGFILQFPHKAMTGVNNEDSTGEYLRNTQRCYQCFDVRHGQDCAYVAFAQNINNVYDMNVFGADKGATFCYEVHEVGDAVRNLLFCDQTWDNSENLLYSKLCLKGCHDLFGCVGLRRKEYCILNKQYSQADYEALVPKIIEHMRGAGEWGEFFPIKFSPFAYNETIAHQQFPLSKEEVTAKGWHWSDYEEPIPQVEKVITVDQLPIMTADVPEDILDWAIKCEVTGKPFRMVPQELRFYRSQGIPIPRRHPDQRHKDRLALRNPWQLWQRNCDKCQKEISTSYSTERSETVYCEECYRAEVY